MRTVFFIPPLARLSGGLSAICEMANLLDSLGHTVAVCAYSPEKTAHFAEACANLPHIAWTDVATGCALGPTDLWCIPESWPNALAPGVKAGAAPLVYVQNWVFMLTTLPENVRWSQLPVSCLAVSAPVRDFVERVFGLPSLGVLPPSVHPAFFEAGEKRPKNHTPCKTLRVGWMPRKNKALGLQIQEIARSILMTENTGIALDFVEIAGKALHEVAEILRGCDLFLSTGFPEGFALPPLEAMATGCVPVGFSGLGGFEYMRNAPMPGFPAYTPPLTLEPKPWEANGLYVADGDVFGAGTALACAAKKAVENSADWRSMVREARATAAAYTQEKRKQRLSTLWPDIYAHLLTR